MINGELIEWRDTYIYGGQYQVSNTERTGNLRIKEEQTGQLRFA